MFIEGLAIIFTALCIWFSVKRNIITWPLGIIAAILYAYIFWTTNLYANFAINVIFLIQSIFGWIFWKRNIEKTNTLKIESLSLSEIFKWSIVSLLGVHITFYILFNYTNAATPLLDSIVSVNSLIANWLLVKRKLESWFLWILVDLTFVVLLLYNGLYLSSGFYLLMGILAYIGLIDWLKIKKNY